MIRTWLIFVTPLGLAACQQAQAPGRECGGDARQSVPGDTAQTRPYDGIGADEIVRFTGTEPFWGGDVRGDRLTYKTPDQPDGDAIPVARFAGRGGVSWSGTWQGRPFRLAVAEGQCSDGMSDRTYPFAATLAVAGEQRTGCAWTAKRAFTPSAEDMAQAPPQKLAAQGLVLAEWRKADNRATCAPLAFSVGASQGTARRATFSGGWAVAWDMPGLRSAYGIAGTGLIPADQDDAKKQRARLTAQWPYFRELPQLTRPAFAGYGTEGAGDYAAEDSAGKSVNSLAYVRVGGQACDYNVWSQLGREHLESLLDGLHAIEM